MNLKQPDYIIPELPEIALGDINPKKDLSIHVTSEGLALLPNETFPPGWYEFPLEWPCLLTTWFDWGFILRRALFSHETINQTLQGGENTEVRIDFRPIDYTIHHPQKSAFVRRYTFYNAGEPIGSNIAVYNAQDLTDPEDYNTLRKIIFRAQRYKTTDRSSKYDDYFVEIADRKSRGESVRSIVEHIASREGIEGENLRKAWHRTGKRKTNIDELFS